MSPEAAARCLQARQNIDCAQALCDNVRQRTDAWKTLPWWRFRTRRALLDACWADHTEIRRLIDENWQLLHLNNRELLRRPK